MFLAARIGALERAVCYVEWFDDGLCSLTEVISDLSCCYNSSHEGWMHLLL